MRRVYTLLTYVLAPAAFAVVLWRGFRDRTYWHGLRERFGFGAGIATATAPSIAAAGSAAPAAVPGAASAAAAVAAPRIWLHAVSLGEMSAAVPLIRTLLERHPGSRFVLTTSTPAGRARAAASFAALADIRYLPYDTPGAVRRFLTRIDPSVAVIMETELWPNLMAECARRGVPALLASARLTARSVSRYRRFGSLFSGLFTANVSVAAQSAADAARFGQIGAHASRVRVVGNVKFDVSIDAQLIERGRMLRRSFGSERFAWVAGSTHAGEEEAALRAHAQVLKDRPRALLLLAPRHRDRFEAVAALLRNSGLTFARRSAPGELLPAHQILLVDTLGELTTMYAAADLAFVGGSLVPIGGHNLLEPAALGLPVLTGPHQDNNRQIANLLKARGAVCEVADAAQLGPALQRLCADAAERRRMGEAGLLTVAANRGSVERLAAIIAASLAPATETGAAEPGTSAAPRTGAGEHRSTAN